MSFNFEEIRDFAVNIAKEAGDVIRPAYFADHSTVELKGAVDLVTATDKQVEDLIHEKIAAKYPQHKFLGEETTVDYEYGFSNEPTWIVDPIDGTTNFVHRNPCFCVSIAFSIEKIVQVAVVYNPIHNELFTAIKNKGAFFNDKKCQVSATATDVQTALVSTNVGYNRTVEGVEFTLSHMRALLEAGLRGINLSGSAALQLAYVAAGKFDAFYETGIHPWDIAAACLLVEEAGGVVVDPLDNQAPLDITVRRVLGACNSNLASQMVDLFKGRQIKK